MVSIPFMSELNNTEDIVVYLIPEDSQLAQLVGWKLTDSGMEDEAPLICCQFELDSGRLLELDQIPVLEVNVTTKDGLRKHSHATTLEIGNSFKLI